MILLTVGVYPSRSRLLYPGASWAAIFAGIQRLVGRAACITLAAGILLEVETGKVRPAAYCNVQVRHSRSFAAAARLVPSRTRAPSALLTLSGLLPLVLASSF